MLAILLCAACRGSREVPPPDAGSTGADGGGGAPAEAPPAETAAPIFETCPAAWTPARTPRGQPFCEPAIDPAIDPLVDPCPAGDGFPEIAGAALYVRAGASGDGTRASPFGTLAAAIAAAPAASTIVVAPGTYAERISIARSVRIEGACASGAVIAPVGSSERDVAVAATSGEVAIRNVRIEPVSMAGIVARGAVTLALDGVAVLGASHVGIGAGSGARVTARRLIVEGTRVGAGSTDCGALCVTSGGMLSADAFVVRETTGFGAVSWDAGSLLELAHGAILDTRVDASGIYGRAIDAEAGGSVRAEGLLVARSGEMAIWISGAGTTLDFDHLAIDRPVGDGGRRNGNGLVVFDGGSVNGSHYFARENRTEAIALAQAGARIALRDAVILSTLPEEATGQRGVGIQLEPGASAVVERMWMEGGRSAGVLVGGADAVLDATDVTIVDFEADVASGLYGGGFEVMVGAHVTLRRARLENDTRVGILVNGATVDAEDLVVRETLPLADGRFGRALDAENGAHVTLRRAVLDRSRNVAVLAKDASTAVTLEDVLVIDTMPRGDGDRGRGIIAQEGAVVSGARVGVVASHDVGVYAVSGAQIAISDVRIEEVRDRACAAPGGSCEDEPSGIGAGAYLGASILLERFRIERATTCGVQIAEGGAVDLRDGTVRDNPIGACVQIDGYDVARITTGVAYEGNGVNVQTVDLPLPEPEETAL